MINLNLWYNYTMIRNPLDLFSIPDLPVAVFNGVRVVFQTKINNSRRPFDMKLFALVLYELIDQG